MRTKSNYLWMMVGLLVAHVGWAQPATNALDPSRFPGPIKVLQPSGPTGPEPAPPIAMTPGFLPATSGTNAGLWRALFLNIPGATLADLTNQARFPGQPDAVDTLPTFETPGFAAAAT